MSKMTDAELASLIKSKVADSAGISGDNISADRIKALAYYRGDPFGNEEEGRSQVVSRDVAEAVDGLMPGLMEVFFAGDETVRFEPHGPEDEEQADQATDYVNHIFLHENEGFLVGYTWIKDALLQKVGTVKVWWDDSPRHTTEKYHDLTEAEYQILQANEDVEITEEEVIGQDMPANVQPMNGMAPVMRNVTITVTNKDGKVCVVPVPPDEFLIERGTTGLADSLFCAHRYRDTVSNLIEMGYDKNIINKVGHETDSLTGERAARFKDESWGGRIDGGSDSTDKATERVWVTEAYVRADRDGDGIAELLQVICVGSSEYEILAVEEVDDYPFACITPIIMPHKFHGMSVADQTIDIQLIKSALTRGALDNTYLTNQPRYFAQGDVNLDDLLSVRLGQPVRGPINSALTPLVVPNMAKDAMQMIEYFDTVREQRTGITRYNQGLDSDSLNKTATGIKIIASAAQARQQLVARVIAETGMKRLFKLILKNVTMHQQKPKIIRLRNKWVQMDPRSWSNEMNVSVTVGLGTGNKDQQLQRAMALMNLYERFVQMQGGMGGIVTPDNIFNGFKKVVEGLGYKQVEQYATDPKSAPPQPPKEDPKIALLKQQQQFDQQKAVAEHQLNTQTAQADQQLKRDQAMWQFQLDAARVEAEYGLKQGQLYGDMALKQMGAEHDQHMKKGDLMAGVMNEKADGFQMLQEMMQKIGEDAKQAAQTAQQALQEVQALRAEDQQPKQVIPIKQGGRTVGATVIQGNRKTEIALG